MDCYAVYIYYDHPKENEVMEFQLLCVCAKREDALTLARLHTDATRNEEYPLSRGTEYDAPFLEDSGSVEVAELQDVNESEKETKHPVRIAVDKIPYIA